MSDGVVEFDGAGMETDASVGVAASCSILEVSFDGASDGSELASYLVVTSGEELYFEQGVVVPAGECAVVEECLFGVGRAGSDDVGLVLFLVA